MYRWPFLLTFFLHFPLRYTEAMLGKCGHYQEETSIFFLVMTFKLASPVYSCSERIFEFLETCSSIGQPKRSSWVSTKSIRNRDAFDVSMLLVTTSPTDFDKKQFFETNLRTSHVELRYFCTFAVRFLDIVQIWSVRTLLVDDSHWIVKTALANGRSFMTKAVKSTQ